jgi:hypothetical protein
MAGTGKSAIATTFASKMEDEELLGATFFVDRQVAERRDPHRIVQSIAYDLAVRDHNRLRALWSSLCANPAILEMPLQDQVNALVKKPLDCVCSGTTVIVIDGLDECTPSDGAHLLSTLATSLACFPIKLFVASRSERAIIQSFALIASAEIRLQDQPVGAVRTDVRSYWEHNLDTLCHERHLPDWRSTLAVKVLVDLTGYLFIYATTILKIIQNTRGSPIKKLQELLDISCTGDGSAIAFVGPHKRSPLEDLYRYILLEAIKDDDGDVSSAYAAQLHDILELVIFAREPVTVSALAELLKTDTKEINGYLVTLLSVLIIPDAADELGVIRTFHQSFPDFVLWQGHHVHTGLDIDSKVADAHITHRCLVVLIKQLRFDICNIQNPSLFNVEVLGLEARVRNCVSAALRYACQYWVVHWLDYLHAAGSQSRIPTGFEEVCQKHLLHWIEALSLTGALDAVQRGMPELIEVMKVCLRSLV